MAKKAHTEQHIIESTLALAAERGWRDLSLKGIAERAKVPVAEVYDHFPTKTAVVDAWQRQLDEAMLRGDGATAEADGTVRDRLFEVVMRRLEAMGPHKQAVRAILKEGGGDVALVARGGRNVLRALALMLEVAGVSSQGWAGAMRVEGMAAVYCAVLRAWLRDDSLDHATTMATLDRALRRADNLAGLVWRRAVAAPPREAHD